MGIRHQGGGVYRCALAAAAALTVTAAAAADYPTKKAPPPAPAPVVASVPSGFFVKAGFLYAINQTSSKQYSQNPPGGRRGNPDSRRQRDGRRRRHGWASRRATS